MQANDLKGANMCFTSGILTGTGAETVYDTTATITYAVDGRIKAKTAVTDGVTPTTDGNTGAAFNAVGPDQVSVFVWALSAGGTVLCTRAAWKMWTATRMMLSSTRSSRLYRTA